MTKIKDISVALTLFAEAASKHAEATEQGDYKTGNKCYAVIAKAITFLKEQNEIQKLSDFLNHNSVGFGMWAAAYLLPVLESKGIRILEQIARARGIYSFTAKTTLSEWRKGNLKL